MATRRFVIGSYPPATYRLLVDAPEDGLRLSSSVSVGDLPRVRRRLGSWVRQLVERSRDHARPTAS